MSYKKAILILIGAIIFQMVFSFLFPSFNPNNKCQHSADYFLGANTRRMENVFDVQKYEFSLTEKFFSWFPDYRMICDSTSFLFLAKGWPNTYQQRNIYIDHPLYNFFAFLILKPLSFFVTNINYPVIFAVFIFINLLLTIVSVILFYLLVSETFAPSIAFLSGIFLVFSPFTHSMINQPTSASMMEIFVVAASLWLLWRYIKAPSIGKLICYSLVFGVLLLGKQIFALSFFSLFLALYFKRFKEGLIFLALQFVPTFLWYLYVAFGLNLPYYLVNVSSLDQGTWFLKSQYWQFYKITAILITTIPKFLSNLIYGFLLFPVALSIYGLYVLAQGGDQRSHVLIQRRHVLIYAGFLCAFLLLFFGMNYYRPSLSFLIFPVIYPTAAVGIFYLSERLKKYSDTAAKLFFYCTIIMIIFISNLNIHKLEMGGSGW